MREGRTYYDNPKFVVRTPAEDAIIRASLDGLSSAMMLSSPQETYRRPSRFGNFLRGVAASVAYGVNTLRSWHELSGRTLDRRIGQLAVQSGEPPLSEEAIAAGLNDVKTRAELAETADVIVDTAIPDRVVEQQLATVVETAHQRQSQGNN